MSTMEMTVSALFLTKKIMIDVDSESEILSELVDYINKMSKPENIAAEVGNTLERLRGLQLALKSDNSLIFGTSPEQRKSGVYFTPPYLADEIVRSALKISLREVKSLEQLRAFSILDPAVGCGAFLLSVIRNASELLTRKPEFNKLTLIELKTEIAKNCVFGVDIDPVAIATTRALIIAEVGNPSWLGVGLDAHLHIGDAISSKIEDWKSWFPKPSIEGFNLIVTNPPWSKLRPLRNEFFEHLDSKVRLYQGKALGIYLQENMNSLLLESWDQYVAKTISLSKGLRSSTEYTLNEFSSGDPDLYKYFVERSISLLNKNGITALLLPSGVLRAKGSAPLRRLLLDKGHISEITEYINRKKIFEIHSMYRFTTVFFRNSSGSDKTLVRFNQMEISVDKEKPEVYIDTNFLKLVGGEDLLVPELRSPQEKCLLEDLYLKNVSLRNFETGIRFQRELDMTNHASNFIDTLKVVELGYQKQKDGSWISSKSIEKLLPVYEGRMIHQFNHLAKEYVSGHGRSAKWQVPMPGSGSVLPHYFVTETFAKERGWTARERVGFCEISGHANERTILAAVIPPFAICGNKVPVLNVLNNEDSQNFELIWLAFANSLTIDWIMRRWVSTTINHFYWQNIPFPKSINTKDKKILIELVECLSANNIENLTCVLWLGKRAQLRAAIDAIIMNIYEISPQNQDLILSDFPQFLNASNRTSRKSIPLSDLLDLYRAAHLSDNFSLNSIQTLCDPRNCAATYATKIEAQWLNQCSQVQLAASI